MDVDSLDWPTWRNASESERERWIAGAARSAGGRVHEGRIVVRDVELVLVPGGTFDLGWDGRDTGLEPDRTARWEAASELDMSFDRFLRENLGPSRKVATKPFLIAVKPGVVGDLIGDPYDSDDPESAVTDAVANLGFRLPTSDEWEIAARAGTRSLFLWGDSWPDAPPYGIDKSTPPRSVNDLGIELLTDPYKVELVADGTCVRGGDGGSAVCGGHAEPEAWYSFALAFQWPREAWEDTIPELFEQAYVRKTLSLRR